MVIACKALFIEDNFTMQSLSCQSPSWPRQPTRASSKIPTLSPKNRPAAVWPSSMPRPRAMSKKAPEKPPNAHFSCLVAYTIPVLVIPAVDIQGGRAVRLFEGDPDRATVYFADPLEAASHWVEKGARYLHLVDLDAATGRGDNRAALERVAKVLAVPFEVGGGVRSLEAARELVALGADRVVVGTVAVRAPEVLRAMLAELGPERVAVSVDARGFRVVVAGWREGTDLEAPEMARRLWEAGVRTLIYTDVRRDGTLLGMDRAPVSAMRAAWPGYLIAGGGVGSEADLQLLADLGVDAAIVGRALYEGRVRLENWV